MLNNTKAFNFNYLNTFKNDSIYDSNLPRQPPKAICAKMLGAVIRSVAFALARQQGWLLLDRATCLYENTLGLKDFEHLSTTDLVSLKLQWSSSGFLILQATESHVPKLSKVISLLELESVPNLLDKPIVLVPFGLRGFFRGVELSKGRRPMPSRSKHIKNAIEVLFQALGLEIAATAHWLHVDIVQDHQRQTTDQSDSVAASSWKKALLWPAEYSICKDPQDISVPSQNAAFYENIMDPITRAQAWYSGRFERSKAVEAEKQRIELEAQASRKAQHTSGKTQKDTVSSNDHRMTIQDASAVYPTPPDGVQSHSHGTPLHSQPLHRDLEDGIDSHRPFTDTPYQFSSHDHQDLFGENDMGLTEADFEFFDDSNAENVKLASVDEPITAGGSRSENIVFDDQVDFSETGEEPVKPQSTFVLLPADTESQG